MNKNEIIGRRARFPVLRLGGTMLAIALLVYLLARQGWDEILAAARQISLWELVLALCLTLVSRFAVAGRWHVLLRSAGIKISPRQTIEINFAGLFASNFLPTTIGGDVIRLAGVMRLNFDRAICVASLVVDRLVGMAGMAMAVPFGLPSLLGGSAAGLSWTALPLRGGWKGLREKSQRLLQRFLQALSLWLSQPRALFGALAFSWLHMACVFTSVWLLLGGMGQSISFWLIAGLWSFTYFVTLLPISINGLGVQELIMAFLFTRYGGISQASGLTLALLMRVLPMFASLPGALFIPGMLAGPDRS